MLRRVYGKMPCAELAGLLVRHVSAVKSKAQRMGLATYVEWTADELHTLQERFPHEPSASIARDMGRALASIHNKAHALGLKKSPAYLQSEAYKAPLRENGRTNLAVKNAGFKKGNVPLNKGKKMPPGWAPGRMASTQFKKGRAPSESRNYLPIGALRLSKDGYLEQKVTDDHPVPARRWVAVHRLVWEAANGPIPDGHKVAFKPGAKTTERDEITLDKIELVSFAEMMRRNTRHNLPIEISLAIQAKACLTRAINRATRGERHV